MESGRGYVESFLQREIAGAVWRLSTTQEARERAGSAGLRVGSELGHTHSSPPLAALFPGAHYPKRCTVPWSTLPQVTLSTEVTDRLEAGGEVQMRKRVRVLECARC